MSRWWIGGGAVQLLVSSGGGDGDGGGGGGHVPQGGGGAAVKVQPGPASAVGGRLVVANYQATPPHCWLPWFYLNQNKLLPSQTKELVCIYHHHHHHQFFKMVTSLHYLWPL